MKIEPEGVMLIVRPDTVEEQTEGDIWLPPVARDRKTLEMTTGKIVTLGPAARCEFDEDEPKINKGDHILYAKYAGYLITDTDTHEDFRIIDHKDVIARIS